MGILKKVLGGHDGTDRRDEEPQTDASCPHTALISHWDAPENLGKREKAPDTCESCHEVFNYEQARQYLERAPSVLSSINRDR